ncbi:MAG: hypothetical protein ACTHM7_05960 [Ginsengibacter sp.]
MKVPLSSLPVISKPKAFFKSKMAAYVAFFEAPQEIAPSRLVLLKIYAMPGRMYRYFKEGYLMPTDEETGIQPLVLWNMPLQAILDENKVFDFTGYDPQTDDIGITEDEMIEYLSPRIILIGGTKEWINSQNN